MLALRLFRNYVLRRLKKWAKQTETQYDDLVVNAIERFALPIGNYLVVYWSIHYLTLSERVQNVVHYATAVVITYFAVKIITYTIKHLLETYVKAQENGEEKLRQLKGITIVINIVVWGLGLVFLFDNLGYNVTAIITGMGIGGIAIALAAQNILGDLFNYFVIFFDRPFEIGDFVVIDDKNGNIEYIGIKTTRIKTLSGEELVVSNTDLTNSRVHNFKRMRRRRILFTLGVTYETPYEKLKIIPDLVREAFNPEEQATVDRVHFARYGNFSLDYEIVYFVENPDYAVYMDIQQRANLRIFESFAKQGIEFAYPTQTLYVNSMGSE
jgi:small-conductance mechanosensitive channel